MNPMTFHDQAYEFYSWNSLGEDIFELAKKIIKSGKKYDRIIALAKGGLTFSRSLVDYLDVQDVSSIQIQFYTGIGTTHKTPVITQSLPVSIKDENILIFDDIVDKGETMKLAVEYLKFHGAKSISTSTLIEKPWSTFKSDFVARSSEAWVIYPNEIRETIGILKELWEEKGDSPDIIKENLVKLGFSRPEVELFLDLK
ncbi:MAG: phosphoribosyltransferase family protein [Candidatus Pacebacteria bacterium]|nr:phosphoribosyltransferase family protein [Candidatus Paceibacterota bacterium]